MRVSPEATGVVPAPDGGEELVSLQSYASRTLHSQPGDFMEIKSTYIGTMISLATVAFGLIAAGAWNKFISDAIALFLKPGSGVLAELIYAVIITIVAILVVQSLAKLAERESSFTQNLLHRKKTEDQ
jgi:hypothetical protein